MKQFVIFDNEGETFDRYTIINKSSGDMIGASENPFHPQGFGQHCGNAAFNYFSTTVGIGWISRLEREDNKHYKKIIRQKTKEIIEEFKAEKNLGKVIEFNMLPKDVQKFAKHSFN